MPWAEPGGPEVRESGTTQNSSASAMERMQHGILIRSLLILMALFPAALFVNGHAQVAGDEVSESSKGPGIHCCGSRLGRALFLLELLFRGRQQLSTIPGSPVGLAVHYLVFPARRSAGIEADAAETRRRWSRKAKVCATCSAFTKILL